MDTAHTSDSGYEQLLANLSADLAGARAETVGEEIEAALAATARHLETDEVNFFVGGREGLVAAYSYSAPGVVPPRTPALGGPQNRAPSWIGEQIRSGLPVSFASLHELPPQADAERQAMAQRGVESGLILPLLRDGGVRYVVSYMSHRRSRIFTPAEIDRLRKVGDVLGAALDRMQVDLDQQEAASRLAEENSYLRRQLLDSEPSTQRPIVGTSFAIEAVLHKVEQVATTDAPVLLLGETGTGKELFARAVHDNSGRADQPLIKVNCAALPSTLIESELFGHVKGAFTGATQTKRGRFELADGGTIFLDEIGDMELDVQSRLLRVLQEGEYEPVGSGETRKVDARVVAATNRDLEAASREGRFRPDLYYRLNVFPIQLPPLRERLEDLDLLVQHFVERGNKRLGRDVRHVPTGVLEQLRSYSWPGNVRELQNVVDRALIQSPGDTLLLQPQATSGELLPVAPRTAPAQSNATAAATVDTSLTLAQAERRHIEAVLAECAGRINGRGNAAERLAIHPSTLRHRIKKLGITRT